MSFIMGWPHSYVIPPLLVSQFPPVPPTLHDVLLPTEHHVLVFPLMGATLSHSSPWTNHFDPGDRIS